MNINRAQTFKMSLFVGISGERGRVCLYTEACFVEGKLILKSNLHLSPKYVKDEKLWKFNEIMKRYQFLVKDDEQ